MKYLSFEVAGNITHGELVENDVIKELSGRFEDIAEGNISYTGKEFSMGAIKLRAPVQAQKMLAMALNYGSHLHGEGEPKIPEPFYKTRTSLNCHLGQIIIPRDSSKVDAEAELVVVMGRKASNVKQSEALSYIFGYTCGNDVSARDWQSMDKSWWRAKSSDTFSPIGPWIVTGIDVGNLNIKCMINDKIVQECNSSEMIFGIPEIISFISKYITLDPGDCIFTGTSGTAGQIYPGDKVEVSVQNIGVLTNTCV